MKGTEKTQKNRSGQARKALIITAAVLLSIALFYVSPVYPAARSLVVMNVYSRICEKASLCRDSGVDVRMKGGLSTLKRDWYPYVMTYCADREFTQKTGEPARLTILYNFGAFGLDGRSSIFKETSPYYTGFYGAYLVRTGDMPYGFFADGTPDTAAITEVTRFDLFTLVLSDFGFRESDGVFDWEETSVTPLTDAFEGWTRITADLTVSGANHAYTEFENTYLQYGTPKKTCDEPFRAVDMKGVIYARYYEEQNVSVFLYALCGDEETLLETEKDFLMTARITEKEVSESQ